MPPSSLPPGPARTSGAAPACGGRRAASAPPPLAWGPPPDSAFRPARECALPALAASACEGKRSLRR
eukprot:13630284-Alexandrium_andersonii.AAC.1